MISSKKKINDVKPLFSINRDQFDLQFFRAGGKGGQKQNKTSSACRIVHKASGAVGECREERSQTQNRKIAFERLVASEIFQKWLKIQTAKATGEMARIEDEVERSLTPRNLHIECKVTGKWNSCDCSKENMNKEEK
jgi:protein subunit release factor B